MAVIGPNAESLAALEGNYNGQPSHPVYPLDGIRKQFAGKAKVLYSQGSPYLVELPLPVPRTVFHTAEGASSRGPEGASTSPTPNFSGKPVLTRVDPQIQFDWDAAAPVPGVSKKAFCRALDRHAHSAGPGDYTFSVPEARRGIRTVAGRLTASILMASRCWTRRCPPTRTWTEEDQKDLQTTFQAHFEDTKAHAFRLEYVHDAPTFGAGAMLSWQPPVEVLRNEAVKAAQQADAVVAFVGLSPDLEGEEMPIQVPGFQGGDRTDIGLPEAQQQLLEALAATGKPLVVVLMSGSAVAVNWAQEHAAAVLEAWYPGEEGGTAIAETLAGVNNPGGRLPVTFYASLDQLPPFEDYSMQNRTYRYFQGKPLYGFGYGLSYSTFEYSNLRLSPPQIQAGRSPHGSGGRPQHLQDCRRRGGGTLPGISTRARAPRRAPCADSRACICRREKHAT